MMILLFLSEQFMDSALGFLKTKNKFAYKYDNVDAKPTFHCSNEFKKSIIINCSLKYLNKLYVKCSPAILTI